MLEWVYEYDGILVKGSSEVYRPAEDTVLLLSNVYRERLNKSTLYVDFGCGSGIVALYIARNNVYTLAVDISYEACRYAWLNAVKNGLDGYVDVICTSEYLNFLNEGVSNVAIYSNPPYLPVEFVVHESISWAGGRGGLNVIGGLLTSLSKLKSAKLCLVVSSYTDILKLNTLLRYLGLESELIDRLEFFDETLYLLLIRKST